jgi:hypothetical protein
MTRTESIRIRNHLNFLKKEWRRYAEIDDPTGGFSRQGGLIQGYHDGILSTLQFLRIKLCVDNVEIDEKVDIRKLIYKDGETIRSISTDEANKLNCFYF